LQHGAGIAAVTRLRISCSSICAAAEFQLKLPQIGPDIFGTMQRTGLYLLRLPEPWPFQMDLLPVDRALRIYAVVANRVETKGTREKLSKHLMKMFIEGERDQHRLTVKGLSYLQQLDRERDSRN
jgi:hypothetical protein